MATLVCFHAHPDDEAIATGGTMLLASQAGHRVILVLATKGEQGEPVDGVLDDDEMLGERRVIEAGLAAGILGVDRLEFLGYEDSGMIGEPTNDNPDCFWQVDVHEAATRLAAILQEEDADILTIYDAHGGYGHPDHIQVHRVGTEAAELAGVERVFWSTMNRTQIMAQMAESPEMQETFEEDEFDDTDMETFGMEEHDITHAVDVRAVIDSKRKAMAAHASQISAEDFFLKLPADAFVQAFGTEWFVAPGTVRGDAAFVTSLFGSQH